MPAVLSILVLLVALYCFWLFGQTATPRQMGKMLGLVALVAGLLALFYMAATERLPLALIILIALWPLMAGYFHQKWDAHRDIIDVIPEHIHDPLKEKTKNDFDKSA